MRSQAPPIPASRTTPLWAVLSLTFLSSIGSAIVYAGVFFLAETQYHFTQRDNFLLALLFGVAYIPGACFAGPILRILRRAGLSPRAMLVLIVTLMGALCFLPILASAAAPGGGQGGASWPIWVTIGCYSPLSGCMWPLVESFLVGGRSDDELRAVIGRFNVTWSSSIVVTMLAIAAFVERFALPTIAALGVVHLASIAVIARFSAAPAAHDHHDRGAPPSYRALLAFLRVMLPVSFMFLSTVSPYMPEALRALGIASLWKTPIVAVWYASRVVAFIVMGRWQGWHGRWSVPIGGGALMVASFACVLALPRLFPPGPGLMVLLIGLAGFGLGVGIVYAAALYYAMEVGSSDVDAGGTHEALIGIGYTAGPTLGLAGIGAAVAGIVPADRSQLLMMALVILAAVVAGGIALARARRAMRPDALPAASPS